jgi:hypothetical protein
VTETQDTYLWITVSLEFELIIIYFFMTHSWELLKSVGSPWQLITAICEKGDDDLTLCE